MAALEEEVEMLAYAASRPRIGARQSSPNAMLFVICGHIVLIAIVMSARMATAPHFRNPPTTIISVPLDQVPPPNPTPTPPKEQPTNRFINHEQAEAAPTATRPDVPVDVGTGSDVLPTGSSATVAIPTVPLPLPLPAVPVTSAAQLLTPPSELKPPYPQSKLLAGEEAALTLRLAIDERGHVIAVDPVGRADPAFLAAARRHLLAHWRYKPAMKDGRTVASSTVITLRFELDG
jgi:protein TonB